MSRNGEHRQQSTKPSSLPDGHKPANKQADARPANNAHTDASRPKKRICASSDVLSFLSGERFIV